jgi:hypothetical protein
MNDNLYNLSNILFRLFEHTQTNPNQNIKQKLGNGLVIQMLAYPTHLHLSIYRSSTYPSFSEWKTVLKHMPWPCFVTPETEEPNTLSALIPIHPKLL